MTSNQERVLETPEDTRLLLTSVFSLLEENGIREYNNVLNFINNDTESIIIGFNAIAQIGINQPCDFNQRYYLDTSKSTSLETHNTIGLLNSS